MVNEASDFSDLPEILNFIPNKVEVIRFDTRASKGRVMTLFNISYRPRPSLHLMQMRDAHQITFWARSHNQANWAHYQLEIFPLCNVWWQQEQWGTDMGRGDQRHQVRHDNIEELYQLCSNSEEFAVRGSKTLKLYMDLFAQQSMRSGLYHLLLSPNQCWTTSGSVCLNSMSMFPKSGQ